MATAAASLPRAPVNDDVQKQPKQEQQVGTLQQLALPRASNNVEHHQQVGALQLAALARMRATQFTSASAVASSCLASAASSALQNIPQPHHVPPTFITPTAATNTAAALSLLQQLQYARNHASICNQQSQQQLQLYDDLLRYERLQKMAFENNLQALMMLLRGGVPTEDVAVSRAIASLGLQQQQQQTLVSNAAIEFLLRSILPNQQLVAGQQQQQQNQPQGGTVANVTSSMLSNLTTQVRQEQVQQSSIGTSTTFNSISSSQQQQGTTPKLSQTKDKRWLKRYQELLHFQKQHKHCRVPHGYAENRKLSWWVMNQRAQYNLLKQGKKSWLNEDRVALLNAIGFDWNPIVGKTVAKAVAAAQASSHLSSSS